MGGAGWRLATLACLMVMVAGCSGEAGDGAPFTGETGGIGAEGPDGNGGNSGAAGGVGGIGANGSGGGGSSGAAGGVGGVADGTGGTSGGPNEPPSGTIPMFVAQGHAGRTIISCDDGRTWVADQSDEAWDYCSSNDCDHGPGAGRGITWGDGWFFATFGWGGSGTVKRSRNGVTWEPVLESGDFGGVAFGNGRLVAASRSGQYSDDHGETWNDFESTELSGWTVRATGFAPYGGGRFIISADGEIVVSADGSTWSKPQSIPAACSGGAYQGRIIYGNGTIVMTPASGPVCYSTDGGQTWSSTSDVGPLRANGIWNGSEFMAWNFGTVYRSADGRHWTSTETVPNDIDFGVAAVSDQGTIVGISNGWQQHYDSQVFYRSEDGVNWEVLSAAAYTGGHPIKVIAFGYGEPSAQCPL